MILNIEVVPVGQDRPALKAFNEYICAIYRVESVNDLPMSVKEYGELMSIFEAGWSAKEQEFIDRMLEKKIPAEKQGIQRS